jgi:hypothetical protein
MRIANERLNKRKRDSRLTDDKESFFFLSINAKKKKNANIIQQELISLSCVRSSEDSDYHHQ